MATGGAGSEGAWAGADPDGSLRALRDRAVVATGLAFTLTDSRRQDNPLVWVNPAFTQVTGYPSEEVLGRNCRFLQGEATDPAASAQLRAAIEEERSATVTLLNYRKDGSSFWNQLSISPVFDSDRDGDLAGFVGIQSDVTEQVRVDHERQRALEAERSARIETEQAQGRLRLLAEASSGLASTLDVAEALERLADVVVPNLADWVLIDLVDDQGDYQAVVTRHRTGQERLLRQLHQLQPHPSSAHSAVHRVVTGVEPLLYEDVEADPPPSMRVSAELAQVVRELGTRSLMAVPLLARRRHVLGALIMATGPTGRRYTPIDLDVAADLGRRAGMTVENARLYEQEHRVAETLQRSLLPNIPVLDGIDAAAAYLPSNSAADVGGDFYDILPLPDGAIGIAVGDVVGHDLVAAAAMGHLRGLLRACAWEDASEAGAGDPAIVLNRVDGLMEGLHVAPLATLFFGRLLRPRTDGGQWALSHANAGHPAPLVRWPDGRVERLSGGTGTLLGVGHDPDRRSAHVPLQPGATLVAYTDGLVERRGGDTEANTDRIAAVLAEGPPTPCADLVERLVATIGPDREDDIAVVAVHIHP